MEPKEDLEILAEDGSRQCRTWECPDYQVINPTEHCSWKEDKDNFLCEMCDGFDKKCEYYKKGGMK